MVFVLVFIIAFLITEAVAYVDKSIQCAKAKKRKAERRRYMQDVYLWGEEAERCIKYGV